MVGLSQRLGFGWGGAAIVPVGMLGLLAANFRHTPIPEAGSHPGYAEHGQPLNRGFWSFWLTLVFTDSFEFGLIFGAAVLLEYRGMSQAGAATALSLLFWGMIVGRFAGSRLVRRIAPIRLLRITFALAGVGIVAHGLSPVLALSLIGLFLAGIGISNLYPLTTSIGLQAAEFNSSAAGSRLSLASGISMLVAPLIFGILTDLADIRVAFAVEPLFLLLAIAAAGYGARWLARPITKTGGGLRVMTKLQLAIDLVPLEALTRVIVPLLPLIDVVEAGTPLIKRHGLDAVRGRGTSRPTTCWSPT